MSAAIGGLAIGLFIGVMLGFLFAAMCAAGRCGDCKDYHQGRK